MHLIINLVFLTSFQFINLCNLVLWVNNRCKWITVIFLNLWCVTIFYIIWFVFFSFVFGLCLYLSLSLSLSYTLHISNIDPIPLPTLWIYSAFCTSNKKLFLTLPFIFCHLSLLLPNYQSTKNKQLNTTLIYSLISTNSTLFLSLLSI